MDPQRFPLVREEAYHGLVQDGLYQLAESGITSTVDARSGIFQKRGDFELIAIIRWVHNAENLLM